MNNEVFDQLIQLKEYEVLKSDLKEDVPVSDFDLPGPRPERLSLEPEYTVHPMHSFKNGEAMSWIHTHDVLMSTELLPSGFVSDIRNACAVSLLYRN